MSLSPKDDPRTWLVPGPRAVPRPPLDARLMYYHITTNECALLRSMCEQCSDGSRCWASLETYALTSGLSVRTIFDLIHGRKYKNGRYTPGLIDRHILIELATAKKPSRRRRQWHTVPAIYSINEAALVLKPEILARLENGVQQTIPGIPRPPRPGEPVEAAEHPAPRAGSTRHRVHDHPALGAGSTRHRVHDHPALGADDSKAIYSRTLDSKEGDSPKTAPRQRDFHQRDFDERDLRRIAEARREAEKRPSSVGSLSDKAYFEWICAHAGITVQRLLSLQQLQVSWPEPTPQAVPDQQVQVSWPEPTPQEIEIHLAVQQCRAWDAGREPSASEARSERSKRKILEGFARARANRARASP